MNDEPRVVHIRLANGKTVAALKLVATRVETIGKVAGVCQVIDGQAVLLLMQEDLQAIESTPVPRPASSEEKTA